MARSPVQSRPVNKLPLFLKARAWLDSPLSYRRWFWVFAPILFVCSWIVSLVALSRRKQGYKKLTRFNEHKIDKDSWNLIRKVCLGNVFMGGVGKSPFVNSISLTLLKKKSIVCVAARAMGEGQNVFLTSDSPMSLADELSDENRERFFLFKALAPDSVFAIAQNANRMESLLDFYHYCEKNEVFLSNREIFFLMDDGLQHFACERDINVCVWDKNLIQTAPLFSFPVGPYREGFGEKSFHSFLMQDFPWQIWSRERLKDNEIISEQVKNVKQEVSRALYFLTDDEKKILLETRSLFGFYNSQVYKVETLTPLSFQKKISSDFLSKELSVLKVDKGVVITGVAQPQRVIHDLKVLLPAFPLLSIFFDDHQENVDWKKVTLMLNETSDNSPMVIFFTLKDLSRWTKDKEFCSLFKDKIIYLLLIEAHLFDHLGEEFCLNSI